MITEIEIATLTTDYMEAACQFPPTCDVVSARSQCFLNQRVFGPNEMSIFGFLPYALVPVYMCYQTALSLELVTIPVCSYEKQWLRNMIYYEGFVPHYADHVAMYT